MVPRRAKRLHHLILAGDVDAILAEATEAQLMRAGHVGGELLDWIAMLGAIGPPTPDFSKTRTMKSEPEHAFAAYRLRPAEKAALVGGDVGTLYGLGANAFLLGDLCRYEIAGFTLDNYGERMRAGLRDGRPVELPPEVASAELSPPSMIRERVDEA